MLLKESEVLVLFERVMEVSELISQTWAAILVAIVVFFSKNYLAKRITGAIEHKFNKDLETLRSEIRQREKEIDLLRVKVLDGFQHWQSEMQSRRFEAVQCIWSAVINLAPLKTQSKILSRIHFDKAVEACEKDVQVRENFGLLVKDIDIDKSYRIALEKRPFIDEYSWALFEAYSCILFDAFVRMKFLSGGLARADKMMNTDHTIKIIETVLPHQKDFLHQFKESAFDHLLEEIEQKLLGELRKIVSGSEEDERRLERAKKIMESVKEDEVKSPSKGD